MQMMTYMDVVLQNKERLNLAETTEPGGLLYFHVHEPRVNFANWAEMDEDKRQEELLKSFKLNGLINSDPEVLDAEDTRLEPKFKSDIVPIDVGAKGNLNKAVKSLILKQSISLSNIIRTTLFKLLQILWTAIHK